MKYQIGLALLGIVTSSMHALAQDPMNIPQILAQAPPEATSTEACPYGQADFTLEEIGLMRAMYGSPDRKMLDSNLSACTNSLSETDSNGVLLAQQNGRAFLVLGRDVYECADGMLIPAKQQRCRTSTGPPPGID